MIPRVIHQIFVRTPQVPEMPPHWEQARQSVLTHHPEYTYVFWTGDDMAAFMRREYPDAYSFFVDYPHTIQQIDAFRYFVLYHYGGIYMDLDIGTKKSIPLEYLDHDLVLLRSTNVSHVFTNALMMSSPRNAFMRQCIHALYSHQRDFRYLGKHLHVMHSTGPLFLTKQLEKYREGSWHTIPAEDFQGDCNVCNLGKCTGGRTFFQVEGKSWNSIDSVIFNFMFCHQTQLVISLLFLALLFVGLIKKRKKHMWLWLLVASLALLVQKSKGPPKVLPDPRTKRSTFALCITTHHTQDNTTMYHETIRWWLRSTQFPMIFVVDSGNRRFADDIEHHDRVRVVHFDQTLYCKPGRSVSEYELVSLHKGIVELEPLFLNYDFIIKITGKYTLPELEQRLESVHLPDDVSLILQDRHWGVFGYLYQNNTEMIGIRSNCIRAFIRDLFETTGNLERRVAKWTDRYPYVRLDRLTNTSNYKRSNGSYLSYL